MGTEPTMKVTYVATMKVTYVTGYPELARRLKDVPEVVREMVERMMSRAIGYGWGRIDAPGSQWPTHHGDALDFGTAYAFHVLEKSSTTALREAYNQWYETGDIA